MFFLVLMLILLERRPTTWPNSHDRQRIQGPRHWSACPEENSFAYGQQNGGQDIHRWNNGIATR